MPRGLAAIAALLCLIATQAPAGATPTARLSPADHNPRQFGDAAGDSAGAPDVTATTVSNNSAGVITFLVALPNRTALNANDLVFVGLDTDRNQSTGLEGFDYVFVALGGNSGVLRWDGAQLVQATAASFRATFSQGQQFQVAAAELGNITVFNFAVVALLDGGGDNDIDAAPEAGLFSYQLGTPHLERVRAGFSPSAPRAGRRFVVRNVMLELASEEEVRPTRYTCRATLAGRRLRGTGTGGCTFVLARTAKRKRLVIVITATYRDQTESFDPYTFRVR